MWELKGQRQGTYHFNSETVLIDQFLASKALIKKNSSFKVREHSVRIEGIKQITKGRYSIPISFKIKKGKYNPAGFSDHLPISVVLEEA